MTAASIVTSSEAECDVDHHRLERRFTTRPLQESHWEPRGDDLPLAEPPHHLWRLFPNVGCFGRCFLRFGIKRSQCVRNSRIFGACQIHHVGKIAIRKSNAIHAQVLPVRLDGNERTTVVPMEEEQPTVRASPPRQSITANNGSWFLRSRYDAELLCGLPHARAEPR
jgi:hypothetical protein